MPGAGPVRFEIGEPMLLAGLRRHHAFNAAELGMARQWREFLSRGDVPGRVGARCYGVMCGSDSTSLEYLCGVEVASHAGLPAALGRMRVPAQTYAVFAHEGPASTLRHTWQRAFEWLSGGDFESAHAPDFELYGPAADPLTMHDGIEVWVGIRARTSPDGPHDPAATSAP